MKSFEVSNIIHRPSPYSIHDLEILFIGKDLNYLLTFNGSDFFWVNIIEKISIRDFKSLDYFIEHSNNEDLSILEIRQSGDYEKINILFSNMDIMEIFYSYNVEEVVQSLTFYRKSINTNVYNQAYQKWGSYKKVTIYDFRYAKHLNK